MALIDLVYAFRAAFAAATPSDGWHQPGRRCDRDGDSDGRGGRDGRSSGRNPLGGQPDPRGHRSSHSRDSAAPLPTRAGTAVRDTVNDHGTFT